MPITDYDEYLSLLRLNRGADFQMSGSASALTRPLAIWRLFLPAPAVPTTSVALDKDSAVSVAQVPGSSTGKLAVLGGRLNTSGMAGQSLTVIDVLNHHGGMDGTVTTEQTTNFTGTAPNETTAALTRHTSGDGVMIGLLIYTQIGTVATTVSVRYTNQAGVGNRTSTATTFGGTGFREANRLVLIPLEAGDTGVRSVEGVTITASTTTAGNFGVVLFKPLTAFALESTTGALPMDAVTGGMIGGLQPFDDTACLSAMVIQPSAQTVNGALLLGEV